MVQITINNQFGDCDPPVLTLNNISEDLAVSCIKILVDNQFKCLKAKYDDEREPNDKFALFCGTKILEDTSFIREYNQVNLPELTFYLYEKKYVSIQVKVIKYIQCCGVYFSPLLYRMFSRKLSLEMLDQEPVVKLKTDIIQKLESYKNKNGEGLTLEVLRLAHKGYFLEDNLQLVKDINDGNAISLTLLIPLEYKNRDKRGNQTKADDVTALDRDSGVADDNPKSSRSAAGKDSE